MRHSLFGNDEEYGGEFDYSSPHPTRSSLHERVDDGASRRHSDKLGVDDGTTLKRGELEPWRLPKRLINSLSQTSQHH